MNRIVTLLIVALISFSAVRAKEVSPQMASKVATVFYQTAANAQTTTQPILIKTYFGQTYDYASDKAIETPLLYLFSMGEDGGFVLVAGDDIAWPILGYNTNGTYDNQNLPDNFRKWIQGYQQQIHLAIENQFEPTSTTQTQWKKLVSNDISNLRPLSAVNPLLSTTWDQSPYYNALCPGGSVTGCVATAMAQVMKYWNHPVQGTGMHSYNHQTYGTLSANFGSTTYQWSSMPNTVSSSNNAVATLMYHCGVGVDMNYSPQSSGAWVVEEDDPVCAESALKNYFGYSSSLHGEKRDNGYSTAQWVSMIKGELDGQRPVLYAGFGSGGGHAFVCDGYNSSDYFHFNWGWGGYYDGYFSIDALDPGGTGTGGGTGGYNSGHQALIGVTPQTVTTNYDLRLYESVSVTPNPISYGESFSVYTDIANYGTSTFNGDYAAIIFDQNLNSIDWVETKLDWTLGSNQHYTNGLTFSTSGLSTVLPGSYYIGIFYRPTGGEWMQVANGDYTNMVPFSVGNTSNIELYSSMNVTGGTTITQGQPCTVTVDILNNGTTNYYGMFDISLYYLDGSFAETIQSLGGADLSPGYYYDDVVFSSGSVSLSPGTYLLALQHKPTGGNWELAGSTNYPNPIQVIVKTQGYQPDIYENNDLINNAASLSVNFSGNNAQIFTTGSNSHVGNDYDYYHISLPSGFDYTLTPRAHDSYNSGNGQVYTNDVLWSYNTEAMWSFAYDDVMFGNLTVRGGGDVYFLVAPYFLGETGTYLFDIQINRTPTGLDEITTNGDVSVFPIPARESVHIAFGNQASCQFLKITDLNGRTILSLENPVQQNGTIEIPTADMPNGTYVILIKSNEKWLQQKLVVVH